MEWFPVLGKFQQVSNGFIGVISMCWERGVKLGDSGEYNIPLGYKNFVYIDLMSIYQNLFVFTESTSLINS